MSVRVAPVPSDQVFMKVRDVMKLVEADGWTCVRQRGSHRMYRHSVKRGTVTVAGHPHHDLHPKTLNSILRQAGVNR